MDELDTFDFDGWCSETRVAIKEKMVLEMPSETGKVKAEETWVGSLFQTWRNK